MRSRLRLWLAPIVISISLLLGFLLTRLLSGPGEAAPSAAQVSQGSHVPTLSAQGADIATTPAAPASALESAAAQEPAPVTTMPADARSGARPPSSSGDSALGREVGQSLTQTNQSVVESTAGVGGPGSTESSVPTSVVPRTAGDMVPFGAIGEIRIDRIDLEAPIVEVSWHLAEIDGQMVAEWDTHPSAVGHHRGSGALGGAGNCVLSGHSRAVDAGGAAGVFQRLEELRSGDRILLVDTSGGEYAYVVQETTRVAELGAPLEQRRAHAAYMAPSQEARLTLITCWPDWAYTHRLIVIARRV
jgi:LPXTG-site transpeptidase (sortase) family protein